MSSQYNIGVIGLGVMGQNLALNIERNGFSVIGFDLDKTMQEKAAAKFSGKKMEVVANMQEFLSKLESPRRILMMVPAGNPVDAVIRDLKPHLAKGDLLIDGGNSYFPNTERRVEELHETGILFIGTGVSGGEEGALWGPSIMPGGDPEAWPLVKPILQAIAAKTPDGEPCCDWVGKGGAGHFVKMVHNGIEYGDMQMISEAYFLMEQLLRLSPDEMADVFEEWNKGELHSYLIEITADILRKKDDETGKPMIHMVLDTVGQKGTGKWTSQTALDLGVPALTIAKAVFARIASSYKEERIAAAKVLEGPKYSMYGNKEEVIEKIRQALFTSKLCSYAQGFQLMKRADEIHKWDLNFANIAQLWRAGCIIRAQFLTDIRDAFQADPDLTNLLMTPYFRDAIHKYQTSWRNVIAMGVESGLPIPGFSSALSYYDSYRAPLLPTRLVQAQRDYFGAHTFERVDKPRGQFFHVDWK
ncbi:MAG: phosphogluconate dehydrogenase (NADP(+)-dependent, decarboxylating) [Calditrichaeota bacterium]|nr:MAG: phosphogluconate dehydrogenase (NADP(+)-dependent, decarboxylating) [Calditrichota bacterium]